MEQKQDHYGSRYKRLKNSMPEVSDDIINIKHEDVTIAVAGVCDLILNRVKFRARRRKAWLQKLWETASDKNTSDKPYSYQSEIDGCLDVVDTPADEQSWYTNEKGIEPLNLLIGESENKLADDNRSRFAKLVNIFGLNNAEKDITKIICRLLIFKIVFLLK